jgi:hypothetical protein
MVDNRLNVLPEDQWPQCEKCHGRVPKFAQMPDTLHRELQTLLKTSPTGAMIRLNQAGAPYQVAKIWVYHSRTFCREPCTTPCPHCGKALRTPNAKQCRFCGSDWH